MNIVFVTSEAAPFAKTGGLADVAGALPKALADAGHDVAVVMPYYRQIKQGKFKVNRPIGQDMGRPGVGLGVCAANSSAARDGRHGPKPRGFAEGDVELLVTVGTTIHKGRVVESVLPDSKVPVYFIDCPGFFDREGLYRAPGAEKDFPDNSSRFIFFSRAVLELIRRLEIPVELIHCNDWQSGLIPAYLKTMNPLGGTAAPPGLRSARGAPRVGFAKPATVFTVHNIGYQGLFWHWDMDLTGLDWSLFNWKQLEYWGNLSFLKAGIVFADKVTTVSPTYAKEIQTTEYGAGMDGVLKTRAADLTGIINGVDYAAWSPETDRLIPARYSLKNLDGKAKCKRALQKACGLPVRDVPLEGPLVGVVTRLDRQKGIDIMTEAMDQIMSLDLQFVLLGTGDPEYEDRLRAIGRQYPDKASFQIRFDNKMAHAIEAGADLFLMPSRYEPCGLNQLYSLKYGTVPIVRRTGGLADTITNVTAAGLKSGRATGFVFKEYSAKAVLKAVRTAVALYGRKRDWLKLVKNGMSQDWSWDQSAANYIKLYQAAVKPRSRGD